MMLTRNILALLILHSVLLLGCNRFQHRQCNMSPSSETLLESNQFSTVLTHQIRESKPIQNVFPKDLYNLIYHFYTHICLHIKCENPVAQRNSPCIKCLKKYKLIKTIKNPFENIIKLAPFPGDISKFIIVTENGVVHKMSLKNGEYSFIAFIIEPNTTIKQCIDYPCQDNLYIACTVKEKYNLSFIKINHTGTLTGGYMKPNESAPNRLKPRYIVHIDQDNVISFENGKVSNWDLENTDEKIIAQNFSSVISLDSVPSSNRQFMIGSLSKIEIWDSKTERPIPQKTLEASKYVSFQEAIMLDKDTVALYKLNCVTDDTRFTCIDIHDLNSTTCLQRFRNTFVTNCFSMKRLGNRHLVLLNQDKLRIFHINRLTKEENPILTLEHKSICNFLDLGKEILTLSDKKFKVWGIKS